MKLKLITISSVLLIGTIPPLSNAYQSVKGDWPQQCKILKATANYLAAAGGGATVAGLTAFIAGNVIAGSTYAITGMVLGAFAGAGVAIAGLATLIAAPPITIGVYNAACKHRVTVYNNTGSTYYCHLETTGIDPRTKEISNGSSWTVEMGSAFKAKGLSCSTSSKIANSCRNNHTKNCWYNPDVNCSGEAQLDIYGGKTCVGS